MFNKIIIFFVFDGCEMILVNLYLVCVCEIIVNNCLVLMKSFCVCFFIECFLRSLKLYKFVSLVNKNGEVIDYFVKFFWCLGFL